MPTPFPMNSGWRNVRTALLITALGCTSSSQQTDDERATVDYTLSPEGLTALQFDTKLDEAITYKSHPSSVSSQLLLSISSKGSSSDLDVGETSAEGVKKISIPSLVDVEKDIESEGKGSSTAYKSIIAFPFFVGGLYYLHINGGWGSFAISAVFLGAGVLAPCPESTSVTISVPDTHCMRLLRLTDIILLLKDCSSSLFELTGGLPVLDTHTHAWEHCYSVSEVDQDITACPHIPGQKARYIPAGVLPFQRLEERWYRQNITYGVLVQPSFMGVNNSYILTQLAEHPRLRGVIVLTNADGTLNPDAAERTQLEEHHRAGVRGIRLNLLKQPEEDMVRLNAAMHAETGEEGFRNLWTFIREHGWHVEAQQESEGWVDLIDTLIGTGCRVVVDHFSRPSPVLNLEDPGWKAVLTAGKGNDNIYMKISGTYRLGVGPDILAKMAHLAKESFGIDRLLWGSDYPHTGCAGPDPRHCEDSQNYAALLQTVEDWFTEVEDRQKVLFLNGARVFSFPH